MKKEFLSADTRIAIRRLLNAHSDAFRVLHDALNFDFQRPFAVHYLEGAFTPRQILKLARENGPEPQTIALLIEDPTAALGFYSVTALDEDGKFSLNLNVRFYEDFGSFKRKKDIETQRKNSAVKTFVVIQNAAFHTPEKATQEPDLNGRFVLASPFYPAPLRTFVKLSPCNGKSVPFTYKIPYGIPKPPQGVDDILDKSGYLLPKRKAERSNKARKLRAQKERNAYLESDLEVELRQLAETERTIENVKADFLAQFSAAVSARQYRKFGDVIATDFADVFNFFKFFQQKTQARSFFSIEERDFMYQHLSQQLERLQQKVKELRETNAL